MDFDLSSVDSWPEQEVARFKQQVPAPRAAVALEAQRMTLVAEGDSWFDYLPGIDVIDWLRFNGFAIENHSRAGDTLENMIFGPRATTVLDAVADLKPKVLLYSAGGNDVAGDEFAGYLNHKKSGLPLLRPDVMSYLIDTAFEQYFRSLIRAVQAASPETNIVIHGYGHTLPTGKGVVNFFGFHFVGPWLLPALLTKGIQNQNEQRDSVFGVIDRYNQMLARVAGQEPRFHYVDLRPLIDPHQDWANELHLKNSAFRRVAEKISQIVNAL